MYSPALCLLAESPGFQPTTPPGTPGRVKSHHHAYHVPTEASFGLPIRRYIAETLICHVLGQPSYSLACFLVSTITQYLKIELPQKQGHVMVPVEDVCKLANDHYQRVLPMPVIQHARTLFSQHDVAWRDGDRIRSVGGGGLQIECVVGWGGQSVVVVGSK